jgi:hypothetical protein
MEMTTKEINAEIRNMQKLTAEVRKSPAKARELLHKTGMYTKNGNLKQKFR